MSRDWMGEFFKAEDFKEHLQCDSAFRIDGYYEKVARVASNILSEEIEKLQTVYGTHDMVLWSTLMKGTGPVTKILPPKEIG